ncbi:MAG: tRNA lysidine(34) synthetase TilS [Actinomycetota bacterium]|nr:tRNA lysidine(34) synthetase TilS [Actinomycetota bacterium]
MAVPGGLSGIGKTVCGAVAAIDSGPVVVALSGGSDSAVAAWACVVTRSAGSVRAIHVDHGWEASADLRQAASAVAEHLELPLEIIAVQPAPGPSPEGAAREARLSALVDAAKGDSIVTGHHADDAVETVIGNLLRGAGATGLAGIAPKRLPFVRPLLGFRRSGLRALAEDLELPFLDDPANQDRTMRRNLIRHEIMPELDQRIDGDLVEIVGRSARLLAADDAYLDKVAPAAMVSQDGPAILLAVAPLVTTPLVLAKRAVRGALRHAHPPYPGTSREVDAVLAVACGRQRRTDLSDGLIAEIEGPHVAIYRPVDSAQPVPVDLAVPGEAIFGSHRITAQKVATGRRAHLSHDWCRVSLPTERLTVRGPIAGDQIDIGTGTKAVTDALREAGTPLRKRSAWPVIESRGRIAWVAGVRVAAWARLETPTDTWIELERRTA